MTAPRALVVMARYPDPGAVKTRLAATYGERRAADLYRAFITDLDARFCGGSRQLIWAFDPPDRPFSDLVHRGAACMAQEGADLGARMHACFVALCGRGFASVVMIGADVPHVRDMWIEDAEAQLKTVDVVFGPSADGGYYLVGMRAAHDVFSGIVMSTPRVLADTLQKAAGAGLRTRLLTPSFDVDDAADIDRLRAELRAPALARVLPATAARIDRMARE